MKNYIIVNSEGNIVGNVETLDEAEEFIYDDKNFFGTEDTYYIYTLVKPVS